MKSKIIKRILPWILAIGAIVIVNSLGISLYLYSHTGEDTSVQIWNFLSSEVFKVINLSIIFPIFLILVNQYYKKYERLKKEKKEELTLFQKYANPLLSASVSLFNRLNRFLFGEREDYFGIAPFETKFQKYKKISTIYRLASLIGWIRAYEKEQTYIFLKDDPSVKDLIAAIEGFKSSLADGMDVERLRLDLMSEVFKITIPDEEKIAITIDEEINRFCHEESILPKDLKELKTTRQKVLCEKILTILKKFDLLQQNRLNRLLQDENLNQNLIKICAIRESLIYRDWQSAIGDLMIAPIQNSFRRFQVIGYEEFEKKFYHNPEKNDWITRLWDLLEGIEKEEKPYDARIKQLEKITLNAAKMVKTLSEIYEKKEITNPVDAKILKRVSDALNKLK